ncbi:hypothetical protein B0H19DRAFT_1382875 [Mycena capillaripes]|nr:hypothetical protein B0H19DRAFT_1382875 [Mycena capillaripes]
MNPSIHSLPTETLLEIFHMCLPTRQPALASYFYSPVFVTPSPSKAPLLLCQIISHWRAVAIRDPHLWISLNTESVLPSELVELWLSRARQCGLSLRIARPASRLPEDWFPTPTLLPECDYTAPVAHHLSIMVPEFCWAKQLEIHDWECLQNPLPMPSPLRLNSLSVVVSNRNADAARWFSELASRAPRLSHLHWEGPLIHAPWAQLTHFSWHPMEMATAGAVLDQLACVTSLRIRMRLLWDYDGDRLPSARIIPEVSTFFLDGHASIFHVLTLPKLQHLVLEASLRSDPPSLELLLERSNCTIASLEIHADHHASPPPFLLRHACIGPSLTRLLICSRDMDKFFTTLEEIIPGTLPENIAMLRAIDRCFHIDGADFLGSCHLAEILQDHFPLLDQLDLDDYCEGFEPGLESRKVVVRSRGFTVGRNTGLRQEYELWWNSADGNQFQAALMSKDRSLVATFEISWDAITYSERSRVHNIFKVTLHYIPLWQPAIADIFDLED